MEEIKKDNPDFWTGNLPIDIEQFIHNATNDLLSQNVNLTEAKKVFEKEFIYLLKSKMIKDKLYEKI